MNIVKEDEFKPIKGDSIQDLAASAIEMFPVSKHIYIHDHKNGLSLSAPTSPYLPQEDSLVLPFEGKVFGHVKPYRSIIFRLDTSPRAQAAKENDGRPMTLRNHPIRMYPLVIESNLGNKNVSLNLDEPNHEGKFGRLWLTYVEDLARTSGKSYSKLDDVLSSIGVNVSSMNVKARASYEMQ